MLLVPLVPDLLPLVSGSMPGTTADGGFTLVAEHVGSWAVAAGVLTASVGEKVGGSAVAEAVAQERRPPPRLPMRAMNAIWRFVLRSPPRRSRGGERGKRRG